MLTSNLYIKVYLRMSLCACVIIIQISKSLDRLFKDYVGAQNMPFERLSYCKVAVATLYMRVSMTDGGYTQLI